MKYSTFVKKYNGVTLEDAGAYVSEDFRQFAKSFRALMKEYAAEQGWLIEKYSVGHYDISGFLTKDENCIYFSYSPGRYRPIDLTLSTALRGVMMRTARDTQDHVGGVNNYCSVADIPNTIKRLSPR